MKKRNSPFRTAIQLLRALRKLLPLNRTLPHEESTDITQQPELQLPCRIIANTIHLLYRIKSQLAFSRID